MKTFKLNVFRWLNNARDRVYMFGILEQAGGAAAVVQVWSFITRLMAARQASPRTEFLSHLSQWHPYYAKDEQSSVAAKQVCLLRSKVPWRPNNLF